MKMEILDWYRVGQSWKDMLKCVRVKRGGLCVIAAGALMMPLLRAGNLDSHQ